MLGEVLEVGVEWLLHGEERNKDFPVDRKMVEWLKDHPEIREQIWEMMEDTLPLSYSTTSPKNTPNHTTPPSIYFSKKAEKAARKIFSAGKGKGNTPTKEQKKRRTTQSV